MIILAFETAMAACSVCIGRNADILAHRFAPMARGQAEALVPMIADGLAEAGLVMADVDLVATTVGPGAFTGVRIGLATARGLALARGLPVMGVTTTETVAAGHDVADPLLVVLETKRADYYVQLFGAGGALAAAPQALEAAQILEGLPDRPTALVGDGADRLMEALHGAGPGAGGGGLRRLAGADHADAAALVGLAARRVEAGADLSALPLPQPLYLRPPDVGQPVP